MATLSTVARNAAINAVADLIDAGPAAGKLIFRTAGDVAAATLTFSDPAFGDGAVGVATADAIASDTNAVGGTTTKATLEDSTGTIVTTLTVSAPAGGGDIILQGGTIIGAGATVSIQSLTLTQSA